MSEKFCRLPDAELEVMKVVWELDAPVSTSMIMERLKYKNWHISTVLKLISRLSERGFIKSEKNGRFNV
ncbi:MAG: BlaI/MecI/CopY family transcriptional regulator, partial [Peptostreptococcaceae bacterium]|nr:BlaI/MecI/CopY family transcriptional regulator [Peptostreptococcaceae bacterium]